MTYSTETAPVVEVNSVRLSSDADRGHESNGDGGENSVGEEHFEYQEKVSVSKYRSLLVLEVWMWGADESWDNKQPGFIPSLNHVFLGVSPARLA